MNVAGHTFHPHLQRITLDAPQVEYLYFRELKFFNAHLRKLIEADENIHQRMKTVRLVAAAALLAGSGVRLAELLGARWNDLSRVVDEDGKRFWQLSVLGKRKKRRHAALTEESVRIVLKYRKLQEQYFARRWGKDARGTQRIFQVAPGKDRVLSRRGLQVALARIYKDARIAAEQAGLKLHLKHLHPHILRHTMGTLMQRSQANLSQIQWQLGHRSPTTTAQYYVARSISSQSQAVRRMEESTLNAKPGNGFGHRRRGTTVQKKANSKRSRQ